MNQAKMTDFFSPYRLGLWVTQNYDLLYETIYIGVFSFLFALIGLWSRNKHAVMFFLCALCFFMMSLGPEIQLYSGAEKFPSIFFYTVAKYVPFIGAMEVPWEYSFMGIFCLELILKSVWNVNKID